MIDGGNYTGLYEYMDMVDAMEKALGRKVDLVTKNSLEQNQSKADLLFKRNVERDCVKLYGV